MIKKRGFLLATSILMFISILGIIAITVFPSAEKRMTRDLVRLGERYYTERWYPNNLKNEEDKAAFVARLHESGVQVTLDSLHVVFRDEKPDIMTMFTYKERECNKAGTHIFFRPVAPYGEKDVEVTAVLDCGFE